MAVCRSCMRRPAWSLTVIAVTALAVGPVVALAVTAERLLRTPLQYPAFERLFQVRPLTVGDASARRDLSGMAFVSLQERLDGIDALAGWRISDRTRASDDGREADVVRVAEVTVGLLEMLAGAPARGRFFRNDDLPPGGLAQVVLTWEEWEREGRPQVGTGQVLLDGTPVALTGVLPPGFALGHETIDYYLPLSPRPSFQRERIGGIERPVVSMPYLQVVGRLQESTSLAQLNERLRAGQDGAGVNPPVFAESLKEHLTTGDRRLALVAFTGLGLMALIGCATLACLHVVRVPVVARNYAIAASLGASPRHLWRDRLVEGALLGLTATVVGVAAAQWTLAGIHAEMESSVVLDLPASVGPGGIVAILASCVSVLVVFAGALSFKVVRLDSRSRLGSGDRVAETSSTMRRVLLTSQSAVVGCLVATMLAAGAGVRSILRFDAGIDTGSIVAIPLQLTEQARNAEPATRVFGPLTDHLTGVSGITAVTLSDRLPIVDQAGSLDVLVIGKAQTRVPARVRVVGREWARTLGLAVQGQIVGVPGRRGVMVNQEFARRYLGSDDAAGTRLDFYLNEWVVDAVVSDVRSPFEPGVVEPEIYCLLEDVSQLHQPVRTNWASRPYLLVGTALPPGAVATVVRAFLATHSPSTAIGTPLRLGERIAERAARTIGLQRFFGLLALIGSILGAISIASVTVMALRSRTREFGVRAALGQSPLGAVALAVSEVTIVTALGAMAAVALSTGVMTVVGSFDPLARPATPAIWLLAAGVLVITSSLAALPAARLAWRLDPAEALRRP